MCAGQGYVSVKAFVPGNTDLCIQQGTLACKQRQPDVCRLCTDLVGLAFHISLT